MWFDKSKFKEAQRNFRRLLFKMHFPLVSFLIYFFKILLLLFEASEILNNFQISLKKRKKHYVKQRCPVVVTLTM